MTLVNVSPKRWTREEYRRLGELGVFSERERVELLDGEIVPMSPQDPLHSGAVENLSRALNARLVSTHTVRVQLPLALEDACEPEPDLALLTHDEAKAYRQAGEHPSKVGLVVEVSRASLPYDLAEKLSIYARAKLPEYWVVNLVERRVERHTEPQEDPSLPFSWGYANSEFLNENEELEVGGLSLPVSEIFEDL